MDRSVLEVLEDSGNPFQISGCPEHDNEFSACNRHFGGRYPPFSFALNARDVVLVRRQIRGDDVNTYNEEASK